MKWGIFWCLYVILCLELLKMTQCARALYRVSHCIFHCISELIKVKRRFMLSSVFRIQLHEWWLSSKSCKYLFQMDDSFEYFFVPLFLSCWRIKEKQSIMISTNFMSIGPSFCACIILSMIMHNILLQWPVNNYCGCSTSSNQFR